MYRPIFAIPQTAAPMPWQPVRYAHPIRRVAARQLRRAGVWLAWVARQLAAPISTPPAPGPLPDIEFCADACAPEGALFVDGQYIGRLEVGRL